MSPGRMVSIGKSRTTGWTSAEYEGPVSLRSRRSWMPARKSCWSRIIGERAVRPVGAFTPALIRPRAPPTEVPPPVHIGREPWVGREGRAELLDPRRAADLVAGTQPLARVDRR